MTLNKPKRHASIPVTNPAIVSIVQEGAVINAFLQKVRPTLAAVESANPDMAIAMWIRLNKHLRDAAQGRAEAAREIEMVKRKGVRIDTLDFDACITGLDPNAEALYPIGRYRGYVSIASAFEANRIMQRSPIALMTSFLQQLESMHAQLLKELSRLVGGEMQEHTARGGVPLPDCQPTVKTAVAIGSPTYIVFES